jgi:hypothetical protein
MLVLGSVLCIFRTTDNIKLWKDLTNCFNCLMTAIINEKTFGGLCGLDLQSMEQMWRLVHPTNVPGALLYSY